MALSASIQITDQDIYQQSTVANAELIGQVASTSDGRNFRYSRAAGNLVNGQITEPAAVTAGYANRTLAAAAPKDSTQLFVPLGTTALADQFVGFWLIVNDGTGEGQGAYYVTGNTAATAGNSNTTLVTISGALRVALTTGSDVTLLPNQESNVVAHTASAAVPTAGAPVIAVTTGNYFWNQVGGMASLLIDGTTVTKNAGVIASGTVVGAVGLELAATITQRIGFAPELAVSTEYSPIVLTIG